MIIQNRPNIQSGEIAEKLAIPASIVKHILAELTAKGKLKEQAHTMNFKLHHICTIIASIAPYNNAKMTTEYRRKNS